MSRLFHTRLRSLFLALGLAANAWAVGESWKELRVGETIYLDAVVLSESASSLIVRHQGGISQVPLSHLSEADQRRFGYDSDQDQEHRAKLERMREQQVRQRLQREAAQSSQAKRRPRSRNRLTGLFGTVPNMREEVDLRAEFNELDIGVKNQGRRPSCAVFSVIGALEYQNAKKSGRAESFSEEYLIWATHKVLGRYDQRRGKLGAETNLDVDTGFRLVEVAQALRSYGVPLRSEMPYTVTGEFMKSSGPTLELIEKAKDRSKVAFSPMPGRDGKSRIQNVVHALNESTPVIIGVAWPTARTIAKSPTLSKQSPRQGYAHAVTLVGYKCPTGKIEEATFIFRNSWGRSWGVGGYGFARYEYLEKHMFEALALDLSS